MNKVKPENIFYLVLICLIIVFLLILVINPQLKSKENFFSNNRHMGNHNHNNLIYNLNPSEFYTLQEKYKSLNNRYTGGLTWESESIIKNPKLNSLMSVLYNRSCPPPLISKMGGYNFYGPADFDLNNSEQMIKRNEVNKFNNSNDNTTTVIT